MVLRMCQQIVINIKCVVLVNCDMNYILPERLPNCNRNQGKINEWAMLHFGVISVGSPSI